MRLRTSQDGPSREADPVMSPVGDTLALVRPYVLSLVEGQSRPAAPRPRIASGMPVSNAASLEVIQVPWPSWAFSPNMGVRS
jgi:hypothetical protein